jgi:hypothetical protein
MSLTPEVSATLVDERAHLGQVGSSSLARCAQVLEGAYE